VGGATSTPTPAHRHQQGEPPVDEQSVAQQERQCFYCLEGFVFIGSLDHDGEEVVDVIRCRKCGGSGLIGED
jgi:hypothetical protein